MTCTSSSLVALALWSCVWALGKSNFLRRASGFQEVSNVATKCARVTLYHCCCSKIGAWKWPVQYWKWEFRASTGIMSTAGPTTSSQKEADSHVAREPVYKPHAGSRSIVSSATFLLEQNKSTMGLWPASGRQTDSRATCESTLLRDNKVGPSLIMNLHTKSRWDRSSECVFQWSRLVFHWSQLVFLMFLVRHAWCDEWSFCHEVIKTLPHHSRRINNKWSFG